MSEDSDAVPEITDNEVQLPTGRHSNFGKSGPKTVYTIDHHRDSFLKWYECRSFRRTAETILPGLKSGSIIITNWSKATFRCRWGCPWHGWNDLAKERDMQIQSGIIPLDKQDLDAADLAEQAKITREEAIKALLKSDIERMTHWEVLWNKVLYHATGILIPCAYVQGDKGVKITDPEKLRAFYKMAGGQPKTLDVAIRSLSVIQGEINKLREYLGIYRSPETALESDSVQAEKHLSLQDLQNMKNMIEKASPEHRALLGKLMQAESQSLKALPSP